LFPAQLQLHNYNAQLQLHEYYICTGLQDGIFSNPQKCGVNFGGSCIGRCWYILWPFGTFYGQILWPLGKLSGHLVFFPVLVCGTMKNPATLKYYLGKINKCFDIYLAVHNNRNI
jgi:hypothetical protein